MIERKVTLLALSAAAMLSRGAAAQVTSTLEAGAILTDVQGSAAPRSNLFRVAPGFRVSLPLASMSAGGSAWFHGQQWQVADGIVSGTLVSPTVYGVRAELIGNASRAFDDRSLGGDQADVQARVHVLFKQIGGAWMGTGVARPWRVAEVSAIDLTNGGAWVTWGRTTFTSNLTHYSLTKANRRTTGRSGSISCGTTEESALTLAQLTAQLGYAPVCATRSRIRDVESSIRWESYGVELFGQAGYRFGRSSEVENDSRRWASGTATVWVTPNVALVMGGGRQPANPSRGVPARTYGSVGMMLAKLPLAMFPGRSEPAPVAADRVIARSFDIRPVANGDQKITVVAGSALTLEIMGGFSNWEPVQLNRRGRDLWDLQIAIPAGLHHINIRIDGGSWRVPPSLPTSKDGFGSESGVLIVK